ncbi:MAG: sodium-dependent bicarbonate transport family permease [Cyanobacteriota bacterium]
MDFLSVFLERFIEELRSPTLGFLIGGLILAAFGSRLVIPDAIYKFIVFMLLMRVGLSGGIAIRESNLTEMLLAAIFAMAIGVLIVFIGRHTLGRMPYVKMVDAIATAGLFGAVSSATLAAALDTMETGGIQYEAWVSALYPFMDIPALVTAIVLATIYSDKQHGSAEDGFSKQESLSKQPAAVSGYASKQSIVAVGYPKEQISTPGRRVKVWPIIQESLQGPALSALLLGVGLGLLARPDSVYKSFYDPLFRGLLSILMLVMGMESWARLRELRRVAHWFAVYAFVAPLLHGLIGFGFGMIAHYLTGLSPGGVVILAVIACSNSDISGPPTLRAGIPSANPSAYVGASTAVGTPVAIAIGIPFFIGLAQILMGS